MHSATDTKIAIQDSATQDGAVLDLNQYLDTMKVSKTLIAQADDLATEHEKFHTNYVIGGRMALYALLGKIYGLVLKVESSVDCEFFVGQMRKSLKSKHSIRTQENSSTSAIVVRYVTRADRKTAHVYARAIESAKASQVPAIGFSDYVDKQGGVEKIRSSKACPHMKKNAGHRDQREKKANEFEVMKYLDSKAEFPLASFQMKWDQQSLSDIGFEVFVCKGIEGRYLVLDRLEINEVKELADLFIDFGSVGMNHFKRNPKNFYRKAMVKNQKRRLNLVKKNNPKYFSQIKNSLGRKNFEPLNISARRAWLQTM
jgi:hypothetical protein